MANIPLTGSQSLFERFGSEIFLVNQWCSYIGTTVLQGVAVVNSQYTTTDQQVINGANGLYAQQSTYQGVSQSWLQYIAGSSNQGLMAQTMSVMANDSLNISTSTLQSALQLLIFQMNATGSTIQEPTVTGSVTTGTYTTGGSNVGNGSMTFSVIQPNNGLQGDYIFSETIQTICTNDSYGHSATAGAEPFTLNGPPYVGPYVYNWPQGSGVSNQTLIAFSPSNSQAIVEDGDFENWAGGTSLTDWNEYVGGSQISRSSSAYNGAYAVQVTGDSSSLVELRQDIALSPTTSYGFNIQMKASSSASPAVFEVRLLDSTGAQIIDNAGNNSLVSFSLSSLTTSYAPLHGYLRTPTKLNTAAQILSLKFTTPVPAGCNVTFDFLGFNPGTQLGSSGPFVNIWAGSTPYAIGDSFAAIFVNSFSIWSFARSLDRIFGLRALQLQIPSTTGAATVSDSYISGDV